VQISVSDGNGPPKDNDVIECGVEPTDSPGLRPVAKNAVLISRPLLPPPQTQDTKAKIKDFRPGDWMCVCGSHNFAKHSECKVCKKQRNDSERHDAQSPAYERRPPRSNSQRERDEQAVRSKEKTDSMTVSKEAVSSRVLADGKNAPATPSPGKYFCASIIFSCSSLKKVASLHSC
jgi:hypothetical protein